MLLLEDKSNITQMNELSTEEQRKLIISYAKWVKCDIYFDTIKKKQLDRRNFHLLTNSGIILRREEFISHWAEKKILWYLTKNGEKRIQKDFGTIVYEFNKAIK